MRNYLRLLSIALLAALAIPPATSYPGLAAQQSQAQDSRRITRPTSKPYDGDLSIFEEPKRDERLQINRVMDILKIKEGSHVADIGAGSGWFTVRAARRVGKSGKVYAVEINPDYLKFIEERAADDKLSNIQTVLGKEDDPVLPPDSIDATLILKTYHEIAQPILLLSHLREAMRVNAVMGIIDRNGNGKDHGISRNVIIREAGEAGFALVDEFDFVKPDGMDYFLVFRVAVRPVTPSH
ncbi:MAG TPA: methyltransferase domain-containing protein [Blastocatellia bacterium]|nr:methyltransferase domain-containing protein [Blastocatellia bacterium]